MNFEKLRNQKGLTGIDVVIAISIISVTTVAILAIFANIVSNSRMANRISAATRIATSIISNIDSMYYAEVEKELYELAYPNEDDRRDGTLTNHFMANAAASVQFNTKIASGFNVEYEVNEITQTSNRGTSEESGAIWNCPLVLDIKVIVTYGDDVNDRVELKTNKVREIVSRYNKPVLSDLIGTEYSTQEEVGGAGWTYSTDTTKRIKSLNQVQPIEWSSELNNYVKTSEASSSWYNYETKSWAYVLVTDAEKIPDYFGSTAGEFGWQGLEDLNRENSIASIFVWIPRGGKISSTDVSDKILYAFSYGVSNDAIIKYSMSINGQADGSARRTLFYYGVKQYDKNTFDISGKTVGVNSVLFPEGKTGVWVELKAGKMGGANCHTSSDISGGDISNLISKTGILDSEFGPPVGRIGTDF